MKEWSRRSFLKGAGYSSALGVAGGFSPLRAQSESSFRGFAYVTSENSIHVFHARGNEWRPVQTVRSDSPVSLAEHSLLPVLYVANAVDSHGNLPRGTVEAYRINEKTGALELLQRQPLSLSGVRPHGLTVAPDGSHLLVAVHGGGAYNVFPVGADGVIGSASQILKELGAGAHPVSQQLSHPHTVAFSGRRVVTSDEGCDRISVFNFADGRMARVCDVHTGEMTAPGALAVHPSGRFVYTAHSLDGAVGCYRMDGLGLVDRVQAGSRAEDVASRHLLISRAGDALYYASPDGVSRWGIDSRGGLTAAGRISRPIASLRFAGNGLVGVDSARGEVVSVSADLGSVRALARVTGASGIYLRG